MHETLRGITAIIVLLLVEQTEFTYCIENNGQYINKNIDR